MKISAFKAIYKEDGRTYELNFFVFLYIGIITELHEINIELLELNFDFFLSIFILPAA